MKKNKKKLCMTICSLLLTVLLLRYPAESFFYASRGLTLWLERMIPTLLPFMILSGIMISLGLTEGFVRLLRPLLQPLFLVSSNGLYAIIIGFLCGFPMGARVIAKLYESGKLTREEASYLLCFCNNIGPIYFISFVLPTIGLNKTAPYLFGMYGLPLLYGIILRHTLYKKRLSVKLSYKKSKKQGIASLLSAECTSSTGKIRPVGLLDALDDSIMSSLSSIAKLGGYMVVFNLLNLLFFKLRDAVPMAAAAANLLLEITSGISAVENRAPLLVLLLLPFGGLSCIAQTNAMIKDTDLSIITYICHKLVLSFLTAGYYLMLLLFC